MARERKGFIVSQVRATIEYVDSGGRYHKTATAAKAHSADSKNHLTDAHKQQLS